jgi:hypothetical protein
MRRVVGLVEYALIELEPAELAVDVEGGILEIGRIQVGGGTTRSTGFVVVRGVSFRWG